MSEQNTHNQTNGSIIDDITYGDAFITLVYGGAISAVLSVGFARGIGWEMQLFFLLFMYLDWTGRIWTPLRLNLASNEYSDQIFLFIKSIIEVAIVFILIQAFLNKDNNHQYFMQFGVFLLLSALWNAIVIHHSKIKLASFLYKCCFNNVTRDDKIRLYIKPYIKTIDELKKKLDEEVKNTKTAEEAPLFKWHLEGAVILVRKSIIEFIAQIFSFHLIIINFTVGVLFLVGDIQYQEFSVNFIPLKNLIPVVHSIISSLSWPVWLPVIIIIFLAMLFGCHLFSNSEKFCYIPSLFLLLFFLFLYYYFYNLNANYLIYAMLIQQSSIIIFIRIYGDPGNNKNKTGNSES